MEEALNEIQDELDTLKESTDSCVFDIAELEKELNTAVSQLESEDENLSKSIDETKTAIVKNKEDIKKLNDSITKLSEQVNLLIQDELDDETDTEIESIKETLSKSESTFADITEQINIANSSFRELSAQLNGLSIEEKFSTNKSEITTLIEKLEKKLNETERKYRNIATSGGASKLIELLDVAINNPTNNQVLKYNASTGKWYNGTDSGGVQSVVAGTNVTVNNTDPANPIVSASGGDKYKTTSTTTQTIVSTGTLTFTVDSGLAYTALQDVIIAHDSNNHMHGEVVSYSGTTLVVAIQHKTGSGTYSSWTINLDGVPIEAITGATNSTLTQTGTTLGLNLASANTWTEQQTFNTFATVHGVGMISPKWYPSTNGTNAMGLYKADGITQIMYVDTTNSRIGIGSAPTAYTFELRSSGNVQAWIGTAGSSFGYTIGRNTSTGFLDILGNQGGFSGINVNQIKSTGAITIGGNPVISNWATTLGLGSGSGTPNATLEIRGTPSVALAIGGGTNYNYNFVRNSSTGYFEITGQQSGYTGYIISTANGANALTINDGGSTGFGVAIGSISAKVHIVKTSEQLRVGYDTSNYYSTTVGSTGGVTFNAVGSGAKFTFSDALEATTVKATTAGGFVSSDGSTGFTGTGAYTNFTIKDGIIVSAS